MLFLMLHPYLTFWLKGRGGENGLYVMRSRKATEKAAAALFYAVRTARRQTPATRTPAPEHVRVRRHGSRRLRHGRVAARIPDATRKSWKPRHDVDTSARSSADREQTTLSAIGLDCPAPPRMNTRQSLSCNRSADLIGAASVGIGVYQESQRRVLENLERSVPGGFASFLKGYLEQAHNFSANFSFFSFSSNFVLLFSRSRSL